VQGVVNGIVELPEANNHNQNMGGGGPGLSIAASPHRAAVLPFTDDVKFNEPFNVDRLSGDGAL
jgi:hypothetical protein